jgi:flagellar hook protein FlgE
MPFRTALSGLSAASADLRVTGNNIANSGTTGFKQSRAEFADVFAMSYSGISRTAVGAGVKLGAVTQQFTQGNINFTGNNMDMALSGRGFFVLEDGGARSYTRDGSFQIDRDGYVVTSGGSRLQAYPVLDASRVMFNTGTLSDLRLSTTEAPPRATTQVDAVFNLRSDAEPATVPFDVGNPHSYAYSTSLSVFDGLGQPHSATMYFRNTGPLTWDVHLTVGGDAVGDPIELEFNGAGSLIQPTGMLNFGAYTPPSGADPIDIEFDFSGATQYGSVNSVTALRQDGHASGLLTGVDVDATGIVFARFTNGQSLPMGQIAVANFANPQALQQTGNNAWVESFAAGEPQFGEAGSGQFGRVQAGGLESSNVDIAEQLVNLITAQRNFQANAQVISTADTVTQTIINIR